MPCYDPRDDIDRKLTTQIACRAMGFLEKTHQLHLPLFTEEELKWWERHKEHDEWRKKHGLA